MSLPAKFLFSGEEQYDGLHQCLALLVGLQALGPSLNNASNSFFLVLHCNLLNDEKPVLNAACIVVLFYVYKYMYTFLKLLGSFSIYQRFLVLHTVNRLHTVVGSVTWLNVGTHVVGRQ